MPSITPAYLSIVFRVKIQFEWKMLPKNAPSNNEFRDETEYVSSSSNGFFEVEKRPFDYQQYTHLSIAGFGLSSLV